ncbi:MAG: GNAT family N-acetyltransferase [Candidatus Sericytochromatia bacterium]|nr:GNAT family N-acetyltransferase [Candidatus Tanganyikabacteria bacterium]
MPETDHQGPRGLSVRVVDASVVRPLRHAVLRAGLPEEESRYPQDADGLTLHLAAWASDTLVGCCTVVAEAHRDVPGATRQLRGMAVAAAWRSRGVGAALLRALDDALTAADVTRVWCNARVVARAFYLRDGWTQIGEEFLLVGLPHVVMWRKVPPRMPEAPPE